MLIADDFRALHHAGDVLLMPNPWDVGSAKMLQKLGFRALATTSSGSAAARGKPDGGLTRDIALAHAAEIVAAVNLPVSADLENGFADDPAGVAETIRRAIDTGLAGASIEDWSGTAIYDISQAAERVRAAKDAAGDALVITARAENHIHGIDDLPGTIARLQAFEQAGADVVFAPGVATAEQIRAVVSAVQIPVSVLALPQVPSVAELAAMGVRRISTGGAFAFAAYAGMAAAAQELRQAGTYGYLGAAGHGVKLARRSFT